MISKKEGRPLTTYVVKWMCNIRGDVVPPWHYLPRCCVCAKVVVYDNAKYRCNFYMHTKNVYAMQCAEKMQCRNETKEDAFAYA